MIVEVFYKSRPPRVYKKYAPTLRINCGGGGLLTTVKTNDNKKSLLRLLQSKSVPPPLGGTLTTNSQSGNCGTFWVVDKETNEKLLHSSESGKESNETDKQRIGSSHSSET